MGFLKRIFGHEDKNQLIRERDQLATELIPKLQEQIRANPSNPSLHVVLAKALFGQGRLDEAREECLTALLLDPELPLEEELARFATELIPELQKRIRSDPSKSSLHVVLARALFAQGRLDEALEECQTALHMDKYAIGAHRLEMEIDSQIMKKRREDLR